MKYYRATKHSILKKQNGKLIGMLILHVDDFLIAFRFCGVDFFLKDGMIEVSMEDYTESLEECPVLPRRKKKEKLDEKEIKQDQKVSEADPQTTKMYEIRGFKVKTSTQKLKSQYVSSAKQCKN